MASLFGKNKLREVAQQVKTDQIQDHLAIIQTWRDDYHTGTLKKDKETSREQAYNQDFFIKILGYREKPATPYTFEPKATTDKKQLPDAVLMYNDASLDIKNIAAVVELKGAAIALDKPQQREGNMSPVQQGFKYKTQYRTCPFVLVSNFYEVRLYNDNQLDYELWNLDDLLDPADDFLKFKTFYILLHRDNLTSVAGPSKTEALLSDIRTEQEAIGKTFYKVYKEARLELLRDIYRRNEHLRSSFDVGIEKAQKVIDRIVFACFAEDRGLLPDNTVRRVVEESDRSAFAGSLWSVFKSFFEAIDIGSDRLGIPQGYNGGLFAEDIELNRLVIGDDPLRNIALLGKYNFNEDLSVNILGHIFEQSISDLEEIKAKVNDANGIAGLDAPNSKSTSKRKKDGVYYTPDYVVRYIVDNTAGAFLRSHEERLKVKFRLNERILDKTYAQREQQVYLEYQTILQRIRILDPACGSGAFLVYAFDYLRAENERVDAILGGSLVGTDDYIRDILRNNLFGVDLNEESVEITKLSLWLKTAQRGKKLTTLDENIRCGNSLINDKIAGEKSFNWQTQFKSVFEDGGFDVVVGNPPYVRVQNLVSDEVDFYFNNYETPIGKLDISIVFFEKALALVRDTGIVSFISSSQWMQADYGKNIRKMLARGFISEIVDFGSLPVFEDASTYPAIFTMTPGSRMDLEYTLIATNDQLNHSSISSSVREPVSYDNLGEEPWQFSGFDLLDSLAESKTDFVPLEVPGKAYYGCKTGLDKAFILTTDEAKAYGIEPSILYPYAYQSAGVRRFSYYSPESVVIYPYNRGPNGRAVLMTEEELYAGYPKAHAYLLKFKDELKVRKDSRKLYAAGADWFRHVRPGTWHLIDAEKLIVKGIDKIAKVGLLPSPSAFAGANCPCIIVEGDGYSKNYLLGLLNSKLCTYYLNSKSPRKLNGTWRYNTKGISQVPIVGKSDEAVEQQVELMMEAVKQLDEDSSRFIRLVKSEYDLSEWPASQTEWYSSELPNLIRALELKLSLMRKDELLTFFDTYRGKCLKHVEAIEACQNALDQRVYTIYGLSDFEIAAVEASFSDEVRADGMNAELTS
ncbi:Eco57I restriction-modification methylase domain-containing protein [Nocardia tengchongensis]|uniref:Eco57I restriction-modification methylase domain-containing protein n=1 Tax=Nocardia tengchongensis TaxID=2055889 RepID=UPI00368E4616